MRTAAKELGFELFIVGDQVFGPAPAVDDDIALMDAIFNYDVYGSMAAHSYAGQEKVDTYYSAQAAWKELADTAGTDFAVALTPGFNDRAVRDGNIPVSRQLTPSGEFGSLFRAMLHGAKPLADAELGYMILVTSWNEWHEDTQIEPICTAAPTSLDDSQGGTLFTYGLAYEGYSKRYLNILRAETSLRIFGDGFESEISCD
jgi:hypothetical protein